MSYLHCPKCARAYNAATDRDCPACPRDAVADIVEAARSLARAIERATIPQLLAARHILGGEKSLALLAPPPVAPRPSLFQRATRYLRSGMSSLLPS